MCALNPSDSKGEAGSGSPGSAMDQTKPAGEKFVQDQIEAVYPLGSENHYWCLARNRIVLAEISRMLAGVDGAVLDVGCGRGFTVGFLARHGVDCYGIEPADYSPSSADAAGRVYYGLSLQNLPKDLRERVRVVLILDVLEHLAEPEKLLEEVRNALPGATQLLVTLPARQEIWSNYDVYYGHQRRYSLPNLAELAVGCDLELVSAGYFFHALYLPAWLMRQARIARSTVIKVPKGLFWHRLLANFFLWERKILPSAFWGTSLLATLTPRRQRDR